MDQVLIQLDFPNASIQQYDQVWADLRAAGYEHPKGLHFHVGASRQNGGLVVVDVWDSEEDFMNFGKVLIPIAEKNEVSMPQPVFLPVHYIYENQTTAAL